MNAYYIKYIINFKKHKNDSFVQCFTVYDRLNFPLFQSQRTCERGRAGITLILCSLEAQCLAQDHKLQVTEWAPGPSRLPHRSEGHYSELSIKSLTQPLFNAEPLPSHGFRALQSERFKIGVEKGSRSFSLPAVHVPADLLGRSTGPDCLCQQGLSKLALVQKPVALQQLEFLQPEVSVTPWPEALREMMAQRSQRLRKEGRLQPQDLEVADNGGSKSSPGEDSDLTNSGNWSNLHRTALFRCFVVDWMCLRSNIKSKSKYLYNR